MSNYMDWWEAIAKVCGAITLAAAVLALVMRGLATLWRWKFGDAIMEKLEHIAGRQRRQARVTEQRFRRLEAKLDAHDHGTGEPAWPPSPRPIRPQPNGTGRRAR